MSDYWREFRTEWRAVAAATIGLAFGLMLMSYSISIMGPHLLREFGWARADLAKVQMLSLVSVFAYPLVGRLADRISARRTALVGVIASPLLFFALSRIDSLKAYAIFYVAQSVILAATTPPVYCRVVVQRFRLARGLALAISVAGPSLIAALGGPMLNALVIDHGWRAGYLALAVATALGGGLAIFLMPADKTSLPLAPLAPVQAKRGELALIFRDRAFWMINAAVLFCTMPMAILLTQMGLIVSEHGAAGKTVSVIVSAYAVGMMAGRLTSGLALDRLPARLVASAILTLSALGLLVLSRTGVPVPVLAGAVMLVGMSFGAESDIVGYMISRIFPISTYSTIFGIVAATTTVAAFVGAGLMATLLDRYDSYAPFLTAASLSVFIGSILFLLLPRQAGAHEHERDQAGVAGPSRASA